MTQNDNFENFLKFAKERIGVEFESPRNVFGRRIPPQNFKIVEIDDNKQRLKILFESGTPLQLEYIGDSKKQLLSLTKMTLFL